MASITPVPTILMSAPIVAALNEMSMPALIDLARHAVVPLLRTEPVGVERLLELAGTPRSRTTTGV